MSILSYGVKSYLANFSGFNKNGWQSIILGFIEAVLTGLCYFLSIYFVKKLNFNVVNSGLLIGFYGIGSIFGGIFGGKLSDFISPRIISITSLFIQSIIFAIFTFTLSFNFLSIELFLLGFAAYSFTTSNYVFGISSCVEEPKKLQIISMLSIASNLGIGISAIIIGFIGNGNFQSLFYVSSCLLCLSALYMIYTQPPIKIFNSVENRSFFKGVRNEQDNQTNLRLFIAILSCLFLVGIVVSQMTTTYSVYLNNNFSALGVKAFTIIFSLNTILIVLFQAPLLYLLVNKNKILLSGVGAFLMGAGMFLISPSYHFWMLIIACIVYTIGEMLFFSAAQLVCYKSAPVNKKGQALGFYRMIYASSRVAGPIIGGMVFYHLGVNILWYLCGLFGLVSFLICNRFRNFS